MEWFPQFSLSAFSGYLNMFKFKLSFSTEFFGIFTLTEHCKNPMSDSSMGLGSPSEH